MYAACLSYPADGKACIKSLATHDVSVAPKFHGIIDEIKLLGSDETVTWTRDENGPFYKGSEDFHGLSGGLQNSYPVNFHIFPGLFQDCYAPGQREEDFSKWQNSTIPGTSLLFIKSVFSKLYTGPGLSYYHRHYWKKSV